MLKKLKRAFTITELVIVIAVIAILASVLIPTFSHVIDNSKKSHDVQYEKQINVALNAYTVDHKGVPPKDYQTLMLALADAGLCDASNPFLLGTKLKQDDVYLIWYENANIVALVDSSVDSEYIIQFTSNVGLGNGVYVYKKDGKSNTEVGFALCSTGNADGQYIADLYKTVYVENGGDVSAYIAANSNFAETIKNTVKDQAWANSIIAALGNQEQGYSYNESIANDVMTQASTSSNVTISVPKIENPSAPTEGEKLAVTQSVRSALATMTQLANNPKNANRMEGKTVTLAPEGVTGEAVNTAMKDVVVDMSEVKMTPIGNVYRRAYEGNKVSQGIPKIDRSSFSTNFGGLTIENLTVADNELMASGSEYQDEGDCSYPGGAYVFSYGLFGTLNAEPGQKVTVSNVNIKGVDLNLTQAKAITIDGEERALASDMAGIIVGFTQGDVLFENITIDGTKADGSQGEITGFDGVAGIVGRCYSEKGGEAQTVTIQNCKISNMAINGQRRACGFVGYSSNLNVDVKNSELNNVSINCSRSDFETHPKAASQIFSGVFGHFDNKVKVSADGVKLTDVTTTIQMKYLDGTIANFYQDGTTAPVPVKDKGFTADGMAIKCYYAKFAENDYLSFLCAAKQKNHATLTIGAGGLTVIKGADTYSITDKAWEEKDASTMISKGMNVAKQSA